MKILAKYNIEPVKLLWMIVAGIVSAFGITCFLSPMHLYDSGIAGTSLLLSQLTPPFLNLSFFLVVLNVPLMLYGLKKQGVAFTVYSVFAVVVYSVTALIIEYETGFESESPIAGTDILLCAVWSGGNGGYLREVLKPYGWNIHDDLQYLSVYYLRIDIPQLDRSPVFYSYILCGA